MQNDETRAQTRFAIISLVRLGGAVLFALGLLAAADAIGWIPGGLDYLLIALGLFGAMVAPRLLARRWRSGAGEMQDGAGHDDQ